MFHPMSFFYQRPRCFIVRIRGISLLDSEVNRGKINKKELTELFKVVVSLLIFLLFLHIM